jgi:hypothetical protein
MREGTTSRVMAADRPYGEFYDFLQRQSGIFIDICITVCSYTCLYNYLRIPDNGSNKAKTGRKLITENKGFLLNYKAFFGLDFRESMHCYRTEIRTFMFG